LRRFLAASRAPLLGAFRCLPAGRGAVRAELARAIGCPVSRGSHHPPRDLTSITPRVTRARLRFQPERTSAESSKTSGFERALLSSPALSAPAVETPALSAPESGKFRAGRGRCGAGDLPWFCSTITHGLHC
jgi:hypothetical protein